MKIRYGLEKKRSKKRKFQNTVKSKRILRYCWQLLSNQKEASQTYYEERPAVWRSFGVPKFVRRTFAYSSSKEWSNFIYNFQNCSYVFLILSLCMYQSFVNKEKRGILLETTHWKIVFQYCRSLEKSFIKKI